MWLFVPFVLVIVFVLVSSTIALVGGVFGALGSSWPWLLIGLGMWMFWHEDGRHHRRRQERWHTSPQPIATGKPQASQPPHKPSAKRSEDVSQLRQTELPIDVQVKVEQIRRKVDVLLSYADRFPPFSQDLYLVRQTASEYLPRTINAYLALPKQAAETPIASTGKTPHEELKSQLDLLDAKLDDIAQDLQRQDTDRLLANRRFLQERFNLRNSNTGPSLGSSLVDAPSA
jgi:hypothetical protein